MIALSGLNIANVCVHSFLGQLMTPLTHAELSVNSFLGTKALIKACY